MILGTEQTTALNDLKTALIDATESGLFDVMAADIHPDVINAFCDAVVAFILTVD